MNYCYYHHKHFHQSLSGVMEIVVHYYHRNFWCKKWSCDGGGGGGGDADIYLSQKQLTVFSYKVCKM